MLTRDGLLAAHDAALAAWDAAAANGADDCDCALAASNASTEKRLALIDADARPETGPTVGLSRTEEGLYVIKIRGESGWSYHTNLRQVMAQLTVIFGDK